VAGSFEHNIEPSGYINDGKFSIRWATTRFSTRTSLHGDSLGLYTIDCKDYCQLKNFNLLATTTTTTTNTNTNTNNNNMTAFVKSVLHAVYNTYL
jgi:hypothetical protein